MDSWSSLMDRRCRPLRADKVHLPDKQLRAQVKHEAALQPQVKHEAALQPQVLVVDKRLPPREEEERVARRLRSTLTAHR
jgi:hypothetical protein